MVHHREEVSLALAFESKDDNLDHKAHSEGRSNAKIVPHLQRLHGDGITKTREKDIQIRYRR